MLPKNLITHENDANIFDKGIAIADFKEIKDKLNPSIDQYKVFDEATLKDAAQSWENLFRTDNMDFAKTKKLADAQTRRKLIVEIENLADCLINDGLHPKTGEIIDMDTWFRTAEELKQTITKDYGTGAGNIVTRQVVTRVLEKLETEDTIYQIFTKKMSVRTNEEIILPVTNSVSSASLDLAPNTEPHVLSVSNDAAMIAKCGRSGIAVELRHEAIRLSKYNLMSLYLTEAKNSLRRWKDIKAIRTAFNEGIVVFDNLDPKNSVLGKTTGMSFKTAKYNGTFTLRDFYNMYLLGVQRGIACDTVLLSTIGWLIFISDPIMQAFVEKNGGVIFRGPTGKIGQDLDPYRAMMSSTRPEKNRITPNIPNGLINVAFRFIISPFVPFYQEGQVVYRNAELSGTQKVPYIDPETSKPVKCGANPLTNLIMLDSSKAMLYLEEEGIRSAEEKDYLREKTRMHLIERYTFNSMYQGAGILVAKNINVSDDTLDVKSFYHVTLTEARNALNGANLEEGTGGVGA